jgi:hypothetical protein
VVAIELVPRLDEEPATGALSRQVTFRTPGGISRRSLIRTAAMGGMALGVTVLSWVPLGKKASAAPYEHANCSIFSYSNSLICWPQVYSPSYCGSDKRFKNGCFRNPVDNGTDCFRPIKACNTLNAWRWRTPAGVLYRCADGEANFGAGWSFKICNARL